MFSTHKLTSEEQYAFHKFEQHFNLCSEQTMLSPRQSTLNMIINEGHCIYLNSHVTPPQLPRESGWKWSQTQAKTTVHDSLEMFEVCFFKLNTRRTTGGIKLPRYKLWVFHITNVIYNCKNTFIWCEKGIVQPTLDSKLLEDLSFLEPFVSQHLAEELGWYQRKNSNSSPVSFDFSNAKHQSPPETVLVDCSNLSMF